MLWGQSGEKSFILFKVDRIFSRNASNIDRLHFCSKPRLYGSGYMVRTFLQVVSLPYMLYIGDSHCGEPFFFIAKPLQ